MTGDDIGYMMVITHSLSNYHHAPAARLIMALAEAGWCTWRAGMVALAKYENRYTWSLPASYSAERAIAEMEAENAK